MSEITEIAGIWHKKVYRNEERGIIGNEIMLGMSFEPIPENDKAPLWSIMMDVGVGRPFGCILTHQEASAAVEALKADGWKHVKEETAWKL